VPLASGTDFGSYHLIRPLGQGGFAEVWEAESGTSGRRVALKVLTQLPAKSTNALERFRQEGRLAAALYHPRCVYVFDAGAVDGVPYISMELMPGGTLADRIKLGPLPVATAVDYVIDMLDGLEAAHAAGIIHRDIKPSNVFLDEDGRARIGDFGISKSLESTAALTATGGFLGTPQYASPEQAGGEAIDSRSDLYSAGTVLYELLTGAAPFGAENSAQALARVLTQSPPPFPAERSVPPGLQRVVYRLLAKQKEKRYATSRAARAALAPYSSHGVTTADLARRFAAVAVDLLLFFIFGLSTSGFGFRHPLAGPAISLSVFTVYYTLLEGLTGASVGKRLTGLRVVTPAGGAPTLARVALRSILFVALYFGLSQFLPRLLPPSPWTALAALVFSLAVIVSTMRRANGFAALHEVLSGTRVVAMQRLDRAGVVPDEPPATSPVPEPVAAFGPYRPTGLVWASSGGALYVAHDDELRRDVWIHRVPAATRRTLPSTEELRARDLGHLPWLQRGEADGAVWDAYGVPRGVALRSWAARGRIGWSVMRGVLQSLGRTIAGDAERGSVGARSVSQVWVDRAGHALLLDFALEPEAAPAAPDWSSFLRRVASLGLTGADEADAPPRVPLPVSARALLARLWGAETGFADALQFVAALDRVQWRPATVLRSRRVGTLAIPAIWPAMVLLVALINPGSRSPPWFHDLTGSRAAYLSALRRPPPSPGDTAARRATQSIEIVLASALTQAHADRNGGQALSFMGAADSALLDTLARRHPGVTAAAADTARAWLTAHRAVWMDQREMTNRRPLVEAAHAFAGMGVFGIAAVVLALVLRGPPLLHLAGISVALTDGVPAGRVRSALRSLVAWAPWIALFIVARGTPPLAVEIALAAIGVVGAVYASLHAERGVPDRVMRTVLVPK
jgi:uncharacterized RDD family membrane protein YckC